MNIGADDPGVGGGMILEVKQVPDVTLPHPRKVTGIEPDEKS